MNDDDQDDSGMRLVRGNGRRPKTCANPRHLAEAEQGAVVMIAVRVGAHLSGGRAGAFDHVLCRPYDLRANRELYACGDLNVRRADLVPCQRPDDEEEPTDDHLP